jgi:hypothetical protein
MALAAIQKEVHAQAFVVNDELLLAILKALCH